MRRPPGYYHPHVRSFQLCHPTLLYPTISKTTSSLSLFYFNIRMVKYIVLLVLSLFCALLIWWWLSTAYVYDHQVRFEHWAKFIQRWSDFDCGDSNVSIIIERSSYILLKDCYHNRVLGLWPTWVPMLSYPARSSYMRQTLHPLLPQILLPQVNHCHLELIRRLLTCCSHVFLP
jgi:hypothetical protein